MSDTAELQALVDAAAPNSVINLTPNRTYVVAPPDSTPNAAQGVTIPVGKAGIRIAGSGTSIVQATGVPSSFSSFLVQAPWVTLAKLWLGGGTQAPPVEADQHRHGVFVSAQGFRSHLVESTGHTGDGLYLYIGADDAVVDSCHLWGNFRNGATFGGRAARCVFVGGHMHENGAQQLDVETKGNGPVTDLTIHNVTLDAGGDYALTLGGTGFSVTSSQINGGIFMTAAAKGTIERCTGTMPELSDKASVTVWGACSDIALQHNTFVNNQAERGIWVARTNVGPPNRIRIENCDVTVGRTGAQGIQVSGSIDTRILGGAMHGNGVAAPAPGISCRSVSVTDPVYRFEVSGTRIEDFGAYGITLSGLGVTPEAVIRYAYLAGLSIGNSAGRSSLKTGVIMSSSVQTLVRTATGSVFGPGVTPYASIPASVLQVQVQ